MDVDEAVRSVKEIMENWDTVELDDYDSLLYRCLAVLLQAHEQALAEVARLRDALAGTVGGFYGVRRYDRFCVECGAVGPKFESNEDKHFPDCPVNKRRAALAPQAEAGKEG